MNIFYNRSDSCTGTVSGKNSSGVYLTLADGQTAFAYGFTTLRPGMTVYGTVMRRPTSEKDMLVSIDSVDYDYDMLIA